MSRSRSYRLDPRSPTPLVKRSKRVSLDRLPVMHSPLKFTSLERRDAFPTRLTRQACLLHSPLHSSLLGSAPECWLTSQ
jgi:hypothetical protein